VALERVVSALGDAAAQPDADQQTVGYDEVSRVRYPDDARFLSTLTPDQVSSIDGDTIARLWDERYGNAADWSFAILGDFDMDAVVDLTRRYFGTLRATAEIDESIDLVPDPPVGVVSQTARGGTGMKGDLFRAYSSDLDDSTWSRVVTDVANEIVAARLDEDIREELGQSYSPSAWFQIDPAEDGDGGHLLAVFEISSAPQQLLEVSARLSDDLAQLAADGPSVDDLDAALAIL